MAAELELRWPLHWIAGMDDTIGPLLIGLLGCFLIGCWTVESVGREGFAPTVEEYERLLGMPLDKSPPYLFRGHYPLWASMARLLKMSELEVLRRKRNQNGLEGLPKASLEERLLQL
ncbi:hypothetical protein CR513_39986, partial [Mucuna pruriens]